MSEKREPPPTWKQRKATIKRSWTTPFQRIEWACEWAAHRMSQWAFIEVLEYGGKLAVVITALAYIFGANERKQATEDARKSRHYIAWQTINSAIGKPGNAGRSDALQDLNQDGVHLAGVDLSGGAIFMEPLILTNAQLGSVNFEGAYFRCPDFSGANLGYTTLSGFQMYFGNFSGAYLVATTITNALVSACNFSSNYLNITTFAKAKIDYCDFNNSKLRCRILNDVEFYGCNFAYADLHEVEWSTNSPPTFTFCNTYGVTNVPPELLKLMNIAHQSVPITDRTNWFKLLEEHRIIAPWDRGGFLKPSKIINDQFLLLRPVPHPLGRRREQPDGFHRAMFLSELSGLKFECE